MSLFSSGLGGAGAGAATGAAIGSFIPGIGTAIGAGVGGLIGGLTGLGTAAESSTIDKEKQKYDDLSWYDKAATTIAAKTEGLTKDVAGFFGLEDSVSSENQNLLDRLKYKRSDDFATSLQNSGQVTGATSGAQGKNNFSGQGLDGEGGTEGSTLGKKPALQQEPALDQVNYNNNNFSF